MTYQTGNMLLQKTQDVFNGSINDVVVCRDIAADTTVFYTLLIIKDHLTAKRFLESFNTVVDKNIIVASFTNQNDYIVVFKYDRTRPVSSFFDADITKTNECEQLCMRIIAECMSCGIPYPVMYLLLKQNQLNAERDGSVYFTYNIDLSELDTEVTEHECALACGKLFYEFLNKVGNKKTASFRLLEMKNSRQEYRHFSELYRDFKASAISFDEGDRKTRLKNAAKKRSEGFFKFVFIICAIIIVVALITLITELIFGDSAFFRIFSNPFKMIGTESMLQ